MSYNETHHSRRSRKRWTGWASALAIACCLSGAFVWSAAAQDDCYRVVDLGRLAFVPSPSFESFRINSLGQAVFTVQVQVAAVQRKHAFLYLPAAAYGLAAGSHDLHLLAGAKVDDLGASRGHDLNDAGVVVGEAKTAAGQVLAFVWDLGDVLDNDEQYFDLGSLDTGFFTPESEAWAINNDNPPFVVGDSLALGDCGCPDDLNNKCVYRGFRVKLQGNDPQMVELSPVDADLECDTFSYAVDVAKLPNPPFGDPEIVGFTLHSTCNCAAPDPTVCASDKDAARWTFPSPVLRLTDLGPQGSEARGVNDDGAIVGWGYANAIPDCQMSALFWAAAAAAPFNLGSLLPVGEQSRAEAITEPDGGGDMIVVGSNEDTQHALRWEGSGATWSVVDLNDKIVGACADSDGFEAVLAFDVNQDGWIIALADGDPGPFFDAHAILLAPDQSCTECCFADLDCNGIVGASDLLALLASWGQCVGCPADLTCDGVVGAEDLLNLLAVWGECVMTAPTEIPRTVEACFNKFYPQDMDALIACIEAIE